jgi:hypothetical protein
MRGSLQCASLLSQNSAITRARELVARMERSVIRDRRDRSNPDCASLHPGYDTEKRRGRNSCLMQN